MQDQISESSRDLGQHNTVSVLLVANSGWSTGAMKTSGGKSSQILKSKYKYNNVKYSITSKKSFVQIHTYRKWLCKQHFTAVAGGGAASLNILQCIQFGSNNFNPVVLNVRLAKINLGHSEMIKGAEKKKNNNLLHKYVLVYWNFLFCFLILKYCILLPLTTLASNNYSNVLKVTRGNVSKVLPAKKIGEPLVSFSTMYYVY